MAPVIFAELQMIHSIAAPTEAAALGLDPKYLMILVHSGSRGFGQSVLNAHSDRARGKALDADPPEGKEYIASHNHALQYAKANRELIAARFAERLGVHSRPTIDCSHNFVEQRELGGQEVWIHRKGASRVVKKCGPWHFFTRSKLRARFVSLRGITLRFNPRSDILSAVAGV